MNNDFNIESPYLSHYGIKGMKWGVRRYQNEDGTLTAAGKRRVKRALRKRDKALEYDIPKKTYKKRSKKYTKYARKLTDAETEELIRKVSNDNKLRDGDERRASIRQGKSAVDGILTALKIADSAAKAYGSFANASDKHQQAKNKKMANEKGIILSSGGKKGGGKGNNNEEDDDDKK